MMMGIIIVPFPTIVHPSTAYRAVLEKPDGDVPVIPRPTLLLPFNALIYTLLH